MKTLPPLREVVVVYRDSGGMDAIDAYSRRLTSALQCGGAQAKYVSTGLATVRADAGAWILLQYQPFSFGRWGVAPGMVRDAVSLRRRGMRLAVMVHEAWVPAIDVRSLIMTSYQHAQLRTLIRLSSRVWTSTDALAAEIGGAATPIPVGTNVGHAGYRRGDARERLGLSDAFVVTLFGGGHPSRELGYAEAAIRSIAAAMPERRLCVLNLGAGAPSPTLPCGTDLRQPGALQEQILSEHLMASDVLLLPFTDGLSTRRTTLMAALAHGLPVVGLVGPRTDASLADSIHALALSPIGDRDGYAHLAATVAQDDRYRSDLGAAGRQLYEREFAWPKIADRVIAGLQCDEAQSAPDDQPLTCWRIGRRQTRI